MFLGILESVRNEIDQGCLSFDLILSNGPRYVTFSPVSSDQKISLAASNTLTMALKYVHLSPFI